MALTTYFKADNITALNLAASWTASPAGPPPAATTSQARWDSTVTVARSAAMGASTTWGQIVVVNPGGACTIAATASTALTLTPTDAGAAGVGIDMSAATQNFTIAEPVVLGSSQTWKVATSRTLTVSGIVSGAFSLTKDSPGALTLSGANTFGGAGQTVSVTAGQVTASNASALGSSLNAVVVSADANLTVSAAITQTAISISGDGFTGGTGYGALTSSNALANANVITLAADGTVLSVSTSFAATIVGSVTTATLNLIGSATTISFTGLSTYTASNGVRLQSLATNGTTANTATYFFGTALAVTDSNAAGAANVGKGFGALTNTVIIESTGRLQYQPPNSVNIGTATLSRNYTLVAAASGSVVSQAIFGATNFGVFDYQGTVALSGSSGQTVLLSGYQNVNNVRNMHKFSGVLTGDSGVNLWLGDKGTAGSNFCTVGLGASLNSSGFQGTLTANTIAYYAGTSGHTFPVVFRGASNVSNNFYLIAADGDSTVNHSSYSREVGTATFFNNSPAGYTPGNLTLGSTPGSGSYSSAPGEWSTASGTLTLNFSFNGTTGTLTKSGASTLVLGGNNTAFTGVSWTTGELTLNSAGSAGPSAATFTTTSTGVLDNTSGSPVTLTATGTWSWSANFTWGGTNDLTRNSVANYTTARTIAFVSGKSATLKVDSITATAGALITLNVGGSATGTTSRLWIAGTNSSTATTSQVSAGYFKVSNAAGLGAVGTTTAWTVALGACLELDGVTIPSTKNGSSLTGDGPTGSNAGVLRSTSITTPSVWQGAIQFPNVAGARITAANGTTFTLDDSTYAAIDGPPASSCPAYFDAGISATLNVNRRFAATIGAVTCGQNGTGRVVLARANLHTGKLTCAAGTVALTNINAAGSAATNDTDVNAGARLAVEVASTYKAVLPGTTKLGSSIASPAAKAYFRIGA